jgi:hypothetical protein
LVEVVQVFAALVLLPVSAARVVVGVMASVELADPAAGTVVGAVLTEVTVGVESMVTVVVVEPEVAEAEAELAPLPLTRALLTPAPLEQAAQHSSAAKLAIKADFNI